MPVKELFWSTVSTLKRNAGTKTITREAMSWPYPNPVFRHEVIHPDVQRSHLAHQNKQLHGEKSSQGDNREMDGGRNSAARRDAQYFRQGMCHFRCDQSFRSHLGLLCALAEVR